MMQVARMGRAGVEESQNVRKAQGAAAKLWLALAKRLGISHLTHAVSYLLTRDLNVLSAGTSGAPGNTVVRDAFLHLFGILHPNVFCDVGANDGAASLLVR